MKPLLRSLLLILSAALMVSACKGGADSAGSGSDIVLVPTASPVPFLAPGTTLVPPTTQSALAVVRERGTLRVGVLYNAPPFSRLSPDGVLEGFEIDLVTAIAEQWGVQVDFVQVTHQTAIPFLLDGRIDMLAATVPHRREMHQYVDFTQSVFRSGYLMLVPDESDIEGIADLNGRAIAIVEDASFEVVAQQAQALGVAPTAQQVASTEEAVDALLEGQVAAVVGRREDLMAATQSHPELTMLGDFLQMEPYAFAVRRGDANFRDLLDVSLQGLVGDGTYGDLFNTHFYGYAPDQPVVWPGQAVPAFDSLPTALDIPAESNAARVARGESIRVVGLQSAYDDPELDGQRLVDDFNRALVNEFARRWGVAIEEIAGEADAALVAGGQADMAVGVIPGRDLSGGVDYSQAYLQPGMRLARPVDVEVEGIDDLDSQPVAVLGSAEDANLITSQNTNVHLVDVTSSRHALSLLEAHAASVVMADEFTIGLLAREDPNVVVMDEVYHPRPYVIAVPRFDSDFRALVDFTLQDIYTDGTLARLVEQYFGPYAPEGQPARPVAMEVWPGSAAYLGLPAFQ